MVKLIVLSILLVFVGLEHIRRAFLHPPGEGPNDAKIEIISTVLLLAVTQPLVLFWAASLAAVIWPAGAGALADLGFGWAFLLFLVGDDMMQYWWHRASHKFPFLYNLHRVHHSGGYMSVRLVYRNNAFYYLFMPSLWISGTLIYLGLGHVYAVFLVIKLTVIYGAHSNIRWDEKLYKIKWLSPVMWVVERTISTPATHFAHHGKHKSDGVTNYKGNYGNLLFFWDVLFGTAKITRRYPPEYGIENLPDVPWTQQLFWPVVGLGNGVKAPKDKQPAE